MKKLRVTRSAFLAFLMVFACVFLFASTASAAWEFGIGTGLSANNIDGKQGVHTNIVGPVKYDVQLDPQEFSDYTETAVGFGGYASDGTWLIQYSYGKIGLGGDDTVYLPIVDRYVSVDIGFDTTMAELTVAYPVYKSPAIRILADGGVRYLKHELSTDLYVTNSSGVLTNSASEDTDNDWTDAVIGAMVAVPFAERFAWNTRLNYGFGGSEGTYFASTGVSWRFHKHWSTGITGTYKAVDVKNGSKGDTDYYMYDADESSVGINVLFIF